MGPGYRGWDPVESVVTETLRKGLTSVEWVKGSRGTRRVKQCLVGRSPELGLGVPDWVVDRVLPDRASRPSGQGRKKRKGQDTYDESRLQR